MPEELYGAHVKEMQLRWESVMLAHDCDAILVHSGTPLISFLDDCEYPFRTNPHFLAWLPLTRHHDSVLLIRPGELPLLWYFQAEDFWYSPPADPESWWADCMEVRIVSKPDAWRSEVQDTANRWVAIGDSASLTSAFPDERINPKRLMTDLHLQRTRKTEYEIARMGKASQQAVTAHLAAERAFRDGKSEFEIHQDYLYACQQSDAELPYHSIVALNHHGAVLHYQQRELKKPGNHLSFLIDAGSTSYAYASDITRTYASAAGEFAELITAMDSMQQSLARQVRAGLDFKELHLSAHLEIASILFAAEIIKVPAEDAVSSGLSSVFYPHGLGHFIGLQTHDVAGLIDNKGLTIPHPDGHPFLRLTRILEPGNVVTIEPGLYFIESLLRNWKEADDASAINWSAVKKLMPYGGIRIEDNVVVREGSGHNLTRSAFATL